MKKVKITLRRSLIGRPQSQKKTIQALGLRKMHHSTVKYINPSILGMLEKTSHLIKIEKVD